MFNRKRRELVIFLQISENWDSNTPINWIFIQFLVHSFMCFKEVLADLSQTTCLHVLLSGIRHILQVLSVQQHCETVTTTTKNVYKVFYWFYQYKETFTTFNFLIKVLFQFVTGEALDSFFFFFHLLVFCSFNFSSII